MRIVRAAAAFLLPCLLLAGCQMVESDSGGSSVAGTPPQAGAPFFVGRWAAEEKLCQSAAWEITAERLSTPGHVVCEFNEVHESAAGYEIDATCMAEVPPAPYTLAVFYAPSVGALLIEGGPFEPVGLTACE